MYRPPHFREDRIEVLHDLIRAHPLATLVTLGEDGLTGNHLPMVLHPDASNNGTLRGHVARANPLWQTFDPTVDALAIFQGPDSYITPSWYPSKKEDDRVVPTWNYAVVHAYGRLDIIEDVPWLRTHLATLTDRQEKSRPVPWSTSDAPEDFLSRQMKGIVGIELSISRLEGKWKVSQNRNELDRRGVSRGLELEGGEAAKAMSDLVAQGKEKKDGQD